MTKKHRKENLDALFREKVLLGVLKVAGVSMWTCNIETGKLCYIGFTGTIHRHNELQYVDPLDHPRPMDGENTQIVTQFVATLHAGRPPQEDVHYKVHGSGEGSYLENRVVTCQPLGDGFYYLRGYVKNIITQMMEMSRLYIGKEHTEQAGRLRSTPFSHISRKPRGPLQTMGELVSRMVGAGSREEREKCFRQMQESKRAVMKMADALRTVSQLPASVYKPYHSPMRLYLIYRGLLVESGCIYNPEGGEQEANFLSLLFS